MYNITGMLHAAMAMVLLNQVPYIPELVPEDLAHTNNSGIEDLFITSLNYIRVSPNTARAKNLKELRDDHPKLFSSIISKVNVASRLLIEADGEWAAAKAAESPNVLVVIIHCTNFNYVDGATPAAAKVNF